jgi:hypothetical protein
VGIDRSDDLERGEVDRASGPDGIGRGRDVPGEAADRTDPGNRAEASDRADYYASLREAAWGEAVERFRGEWDEHRKRWPDEAREPADRSADPPGSWRGDSNRYLDGTANAEVDARYDRIADVERSVVSPAMREVEACDSSRTLVGWEYRLKAADRLKDKVAETMAEQPELTAREAVADLSDSIRFTFRYREEDYCDGVRRDMARIDEHGFEPVRLKNYWSNDQYKGINSQWVEPDSGQRFEVQFHTHASFEAKQLTHGTYERLRCEVDSEVEEGELEELQRELAENVPVPPDAQDIKEGEWRARLPITPSLLIAAAERSLRESYGGPTQKQGGDGTRRSRGTWRGNTARH